MQADRASIWSKTGVAVLRDAGLQELPAAVTEVAANLHALDCRGNNLASVRPRGMRPDSPSIC